MVWNAESSTLYQAVERHNEEIHHPNPHINEKPDRISEKQFSERTLHPPRHQDMFSSLLNDRDSLLIVAVILILLHEKADTKLILALAFVLFS